MSPCPSGYEDGRGGVMAVGVPFFKQGVLPFQSGRVDLVHACLCVPVGILVPVHMVSPPGSEIGKSPQLLEASRCELVIKINLHLYTILQRMQTDWFGAILPFRQSREVSQAGREWSDSHLLPV